MFDGNKTNEPYVVYQNIFGEKQRWRLRRVLLIGRSRVSSLRLQDPAISRFHCLLFPVRPARERSDARPVWYLADLNSLNGTYVNGQRVQQPRQLRHLDCIRFGRTHLATVFLFD